MKKLTVIYDIECEICTRLRAWLEKQAKFCPMKFVSLQDPDLEGRFLGIGASDPGGIRFDRRVGAVRR